MPPQRDARGRFIKGSGGATKVKDTDRGFNRMWRTFRAHRGGPHARVGIQGTDASEPHGFGQTNLTIAAVHEFGAKNGRPPQRSFIRATIDRERSQLTRLLRREARAMAFDGDWRRHLGIVGAKARAEMVRTIDQSIGLKPLTPAGIRSKQVPSTQPLIDTGQLKGAISWEVRAT